MYVMQVAVPYISFQWYQNQKHRHLWYKYPTRPMILSAKAPHLHIEGYRELCKEWFSTQRLKDEWNQRGNS